MRRLLVAAALAAAQGAASPQAGDEVPFITTPDHVTVAMLELAAVTPADHVLDLGSGDGRIVITAARRFGASGAGVEIVPDLVERSRENARRAGVADRVRFAVQDLFETDLSAATVVTMYLLPEVNLQLRPRLLALAPGTRVVSHDWDMGDWAPDRTVTVAVAEKAVGLEKTSRLHLWVVPAPLAGLWCGGPGRQLRIEQRHQFVQARAELGAEGWSLVGRVDGRRLALQDLAGRSWQAEWREGQLSAGPGPAAGAWRRAAGERCTD